MTEAVRRTTSLPIDCHLMISDPDRYAVRFVQAGADMVSVHVEDGEPVFTHEVEGDTVADVLSYVEYDPRKLESNFRHFAEAAVKAGRITAVERREILESFRASLRGYTYFES